jgi:hypothetical protein
MNLTVKNSMNSHNNEFIVFTDEFIYNKIRWIHYKIRRQMNSLTAILVQMNATAIPQLLLPPCPCNPATPLLTHHCPADYTVMPTLPTRSHGEHCTGDAKLPPHCCRAASADDAGWAN